MKKMIKIMSMALVVVMMFMAVSVFAEGDGVGAMPTIGGYNNTKANSTAIKILGFVRWIGYAIAIGMLIYIGIKYVTSPAAEKADTKQALVKYVIGAVLIAGASTIAGWIFELGLSV